MFNREFVLVLIVLSLVSSYTRTDRWQLPQQEYMVLASTANELRQDKYNHVNPKKLKAAAEGLSQSMFYWSFKSPINFTWILVL